MASADSTVAFHSALPDREGVDAYFSALQAAAALVAATQAADVAARHVGIAEEAVAYWAGRLEMYGDVEGEGESKDEGTGEGNKGKGKEKAEGVNMGKGKGKMKEVKVEKEKNGIKKDMNVKEKTNSKGALNDKNKTSDKNTTNDKNKITDQATNNNEKSTTNDPKDAPEDNKVKRKKERKIVIARIAETKEYLANICRCYEIALADEERAEKQWNETTKTAAQFPHPIIISDE